MNDKYNVRMISWTKDENDMPMPNNMASHFAKDFDTAADKLLEIVKTGLSNGFVKVVISDGVEKIGMTIELETIGK